MLISFLKKPFIFLHLIKNIENSTCALSASDICNSEILLIIKISIFNMDEKFKIFESHSKKVTYSKEEDDNGVSERRRPRFVFLIIS